MKAFTYILLFYLTITSCRKETVLLEPFSDNEISFYTDLQSYHEEDSINIFLKNNSPFDLITGLRCGKFLEMGFQMKEKEEWSAEKYFWYMQLRCPTFPDTIQANSTYTYRFPATLFDTTGAFRLLLPCYYSENDTTLTVVSNSFVIY